MALVGHQEERDVADEHRPSREGERRTFLHVTSLLFALAAIKIGSRDIRMISHGRAVVRRGVQLGEAADVSQPPAEDREEDAEGNRK